MVMRWRQQARQFIDLQRPAERVAVIDLDARDVGDARDLAPAPGALEGGLADAEDALDVGGSEPLPARWAMKASSCGGFVASAMLASPKKSTQ
jgi:hypothetical protein